MKEYDFKKIEKKWQDKWDTEKPFRAVDFDTTRPKYYVLYEFFNISGNLHMGHLKGTVPADALARYKRLAGYNVLFPIGGDAFGLPAENAAIKTGINPKDFVAKGMKTVTEQSKLIGLSFDWDRTICTSDPAYYKWTQWIFLQLLKNDKAYKKEGYVNFCPKCKTVLSNEDSQGGKCDRCGSDVVQKKRWVWFLKMKEYSQKLLDNVDRIEMADNLKEAQRNWIGKSEGIELTFPLVDESGNEFDKVTVFTTCIETVYGVSFVLLAPEHPFVKKYADKIQNLSDAEDYCYKTSLRSEFDRMSDVKSKTGCELKGIYAINPANGAKVPVYLADFVLANYGTGAVMAVACHDQRDFEFADAFGIEKLQVIEGDCAERAVEKKEYLEADSLMINSEEFTGMHVKEAKAAIADKLVGMGAAERVTNFRMQDWPFNRQRYWGEPFPVVFCDNCGTVPLPEDELPLELPYTNDYLPNETGDSPLSKVTEWVECSCPKCGGKAVRETDTMPNWAGSSWYWLRYIDPHNESALADIEKLKYWGSVDCYTGGTEHITRHVLYAFFWQNFLYEIGAVPSRDPFIRKMGSGLILDDQGKKMSKSSTNGVSPLEVLDKYGADATRLHVHFLGGYEDNTPWTYDGIKGITNFIDNVWRLQDMIKGDEVSEKHIYDLNRLIKKMGEDYEDLKLNTAIAACMKFVKGINADGYITREELRQFLIMLNPLAPHITSEMYENVFGGELINDKWPEYDEKYLVEDTVEIPVQVNGKLRDKVKVDRAITADEIRKLIDTEYSSLIPDGKSIVKFIYVPGRIVNIVVK
ncbi:MAG: leucine--tRNA ligase [Ruminococcus sp.]|nr:leucine--tRNA ligase [Ruminococcus sp.]